jgi:hypothetical protein
MNRKQTEFEWDYVPAKIRRRVRCIGAALLLLALAAGAVLGGGSGDEVRFFYKAIAVKGTSGQATKETPEPDTADHVEAETPPAAPRQAEPPAPAIGPPPQPPPRLDPPQTTSQVAAAAHARLDVRDELEVPPESPPAEPDPTAQKLDEPPSSEDQPDDVPPIPATLPPPAHGGLAESAEQAAANVGSHDIVEGVTAPYYRLTSLDEYLRTAWEHGGRFLAWNGQVAVSIGRSLDPAAASLEVLDSSWHRRYATRAAPLPQNTPPVLAIRQRVLTDYPNLGPRTQIMLSLPYAYDQEILRGQREWFESRGLSVDVQAVTEGHFQPAPGGGLPRFQIEQVLRDGRPIPDPPSPPEPPLSRHPDEP